VLLHYIQALAFRLLAVFFLALALWVNLLFLLQVGWFQVDF
jgi:hypothetical protein